MTSGRDAGGAGRRLDDRHGRPCPSKLLSESAIHLCVGEHDAFGIEDRRGDESDRPDHDDVLVESAEPLIEASGDQALHRGYSKLRERLSAS